MEKLKSSIHTARMIAGTAKALGEAVMGGVDLDNHTEVPISVLSGDEHFMRALEQLRQRRGLHLINGEG